MSVPASVTIDCPYPGLRPFRSDEEIYFFGRDEQVDQLIERLKTRRFLAVVGTSGSGKSSLVQAGLIPALQTGLMGEAGARWTFATMRPGDQPFRRLAASLERTSALGPSWTGLDHPRAFLEAALRRGPLGLVEVIGGSSLPGDRKLLLLVDQFEEIFRYRRDGRNARQDAGQLDRDEAIDFVALLLATAAAESLSVYIVLTMRSDYIGDCALFDGLPEALNDSQFLTPRLTRDQRREAIESPARVCGGLAEPPLVNRLLNDMGSDPDQLPLMQHALMRLWKGAAPTCDGSRVLTLAAYEAMGGLRDALDDQADLAFHSLDSSKQRIAEVLFRRLSERTGVGRDVRRPTPLREIAEVACESEDAIRAVVDVFRQPDLCFLTPPWPDAIASDDRLDISHESLIHHWTKLRNWVLAESRQAEMFRRLDSDAEKYPEEAGLWGPPQLDLALDWQAENRPNQAWAARYGGNMERALAFLEKSRQKRDDEEARKLEEERSRAASEAERKRLAEQVKLREAEGQLALEKERAASERARLEAEVAARQRRLNVALATVLVAVAGLGSLAAMQYLVARAEAKRARAAEAQATDNAKQANDAGLGAKIEAANARDAQKRASDEAANARAAEKRASGEAANARAAEKRASGEAVHARALKLWAQADLRPRDQFDLSLLLNVEAYRVERNYETFSALFAATRSKPRLIRLLFAHKGSVTAVAFSPDGTTLASGSDDKTVILWDATTKRPRGLPLTAHKAAVVGVAYAPDGKTLASASTDGTVILWDLVAGKPRGEPLAGHTGAVASLAYSPDGKTLATSSYDETVILWDPTTGKPRGEPLKWHTGPVYGVAFSPDGKTLASASEDKTVILWDPTTGKPRGVPLRGHKGDVVGLSFSPGGHLVASASRDETVILWDVATQKPRGKPLTGHTKPVSSVAFSPGGQSLASGSFDGTVILWDAVTGKPRGEPLTGHKGPVYSVAYSPDGKTVASASWDQAAILWNAGAGEPSGEILTGHREAVVDAVFSPDGKTLASASEDKTVILWDAVTKKPRGQPLEGHNGTVTGLAYSPDGETLASASRDGTVILWNTQTGKPRGEPLTRHHGAVYGVAYSPDGQTLASASEDKAVILWNTQTGKPRGEPLARHKDSVVGVAYSPDGKTLASASRDGTVILWDPQTGKPRGEPLTRQKGAAVYGVAYSPDGKTLAVAFSPPLVKSLTYEFEEKTVILWDTSTGKPRGEPLAKHKEIVISVAYSPDGKTLASASLDNTVILWDAATAKPWGELLAGNGAELNSVAFSPDGKTLASASEDKTVILWDLDPESWQKKVRRRAGRNLSLAEWKEYLGPDVPYRVSTPEFPMGEGVTAADLSPARVLPQSAPDTSK